jgi:hypothetical protein
MSIYMGRKYVQISLYTVICLAVSSFVYGQEMWTLRKQTDDITIYTRMREDSPLKEYRVEANIHAPIQVVYEFLSNVSLHPEWVYQCAGLKVLEEVKNSFVIYHTSYDIPWPAADRDLLAKAVITLADDFSSVHIFTENVSLNYEKVKGVVRMPDYREDVTLEPLDEANTLFKVEGFANPGGTLPPWLINMFMVDGIYNSIVKTKELTEKR